MNSKYKRAKNRNSRNKKSRSRSQSKSRTSRSRSKSRKSHSRSRNSYSRSRTSRSGSRSRTSRSRSRTSRSRSRSQSRERMRSLSRGRSRQESRTIRKRVDRDELNPITLEPFSENYFKLQERVREYPASQPDVKQSLFNLLDQTNIILLTGDTGSGKTTQVPKHLWEYLDYVDTVVCTQPRTLTASRVSERVAQELDVEFGKEVGFRFRGSEKEKGGDITGLGILVYMTEGTFLNNTFKNPSSLAYYGGIVIDEAHDRNIDTDFLMFYLRETLKIVGLRTKIIVMSATLDKDIFLDYFKDYGVRHMHIPGKTFEVDSRFLTKSIYQPVMSSGNSRKVYEALGGMAKKICLDIMSKPEKKSKGDILVFLPVIRLINELKKEIKDALDKAGIKNFEVMTLSSATPEEERGPITQPLPGRNKIVLSTNIAETGVTISGIYYVVESGIVFEPSYNMIDRVATLDLNFISKSEAKQRRGRAGRNRPGVCFHLYTPDEYQGMIDFRKPEIYRANFDKTYLKLFYQFKNVDNGQQYVKEVLSMLLSPPDEEAVNSTRRMFRKLGLISSDLEKDRMTLLGECYSLMDLELDLTNLYLVGTAYEIESEIWADFIAMLVVARKSNLSPWFRVRKIPEEFKNNYINDYGDMIGLYHIYLDYKDGKLPEEYQRMINTELMDEIEKASLEILQSAIGNNLLCTQQVKTKYKIKKDMYANVVSAFRQAFPNNIVKVKNLDLSRINYSFINLKKETEVLAISKVKLSSFGQKSKEVYDNFIKIN